MHSKKVMLLFFMTLLLVGAGISVSFAITKLTADEPVPKPEPTTRFYVINESEIYFGKPAFYRIIVENQEGNTTDYELKAKLAGEELYGEAITLNQSDIFNQTISFIPDRAGDYQKLEFPLYKGNELYRTRVFQVSPEIESISASNYSLASKLTITPPKLQNSDMEKNIGWNFTGTEFTGNYTGSEKSSGNRSYQIKAEKGVKKDSSGSIKQNFSSDKKGFVSLSFDAKSSNASYHLQAMVNDEIVWENTTGKDWQRINLPVFLKNSNVLELKVIAKNDTKSGIVLWLDNIKFENYSTVKIENISKAKKPEKELYIMQKKGDIIIYKFNTGEKLELKVSKGSVNRGDAVYTTANKEDRIIFLGEAYEKILPGTANLLLPVRMELKDKKLKINESIELNDGYAVKLKNIQNDSLYISIYKNKKALWDIISKGNSSIEYWKEIDDYKKQKAIKLIPSKINTSEAVFNITQYGEKKSIFTGNKYVEFQVTSVTKDSIIMKNIQPITTETGKEISLINGKIKIKV